MPRRPLTVARIAALTVIATVAHLGTAEARLAVYAPKAASSERVSFRVTGIPGSSVRRAGIRVGRSHRSLRLRRVRAGVRRGRVVVRLHSLRRPRRVRLVLRLGTGPDAARKPTAAPGKPKPEPAPAPAPAPAPEPAPSTEPVPSEPVPSDPVSPDPAPAPADCLPALTAFQAGSWPAACWRPFAATSPFNRPIPDGRPVNANSAAIVKRMLSLYGGPAKMTAGDADSIYDYSHPLYYPTASDPVFTLHCYEASWGTCPIEGHRSASRTRPGRPAGATRTSR